jgi:C-terminal processing protease CtpA/Prc/Tol biopolymer transport system component
MSELYTVPIAGGRVDQVKSTPALAPQLNSTGSIVIYDDIKGYEDLFRKHHKSAVTHDIWSYNIPTKEYTQLTSFEGEDRNPVFASNDEDFYYLSEEDGSFNVYRRKLTGGESVQVTEFKNHPVRYLSIADDNTLCFSYDGEIYVQRNEGEPVELQISTAVDGLANLEQVVPISGKFTEVELSPNGKEFAFVYRGEIFVCDLEGGITKRITDTPCQERSVSFSPDGRKLLYAAEVNSSWNVYTKSIVRDDEPYFFASTVLEEETIIATEAEEFQPAFSPDGTEVAYLEERVILKVINLETEETRTIMSAEHNYSYADGDQHYQWSPDSKWFLVSFGLPERVMSPEVGLVSASGNGEIINLTLSGYDDYGPKWARDGKMVIFGSNRLGDRQEGGRLTTGDVFGLFFSKEEHDRFKLSKEELALLKEKEEKEKKGQKDADDKEKKEDSTSADEKKDEDVEPIQIDWDNLTERKERLTTHTTRLSDWVLSKDGEKLYYVTRFETTADIWVTDLRKKESKEFAKLGARGGASMLLSQDGEFLLVLSDGSVKKVSTKDGKVTQVKVKGEMILRTDQERAYIFDHSWRQLKKKFYVPDLHGVDWDFYYDEYKKFLPYINNNYDFAEMLSEMLGEMNASHTGARYRYSADNADSTASLGLLFDYAHKGSGLKVAEVILGGPLDKASSEIRAGHVVERIDGIELTQDFDFYKLLNRKVGKLTLLSVYDPANDKRWEEQVKPIALGAEGRLLYERWVRNRRAETERLSEGKIGYVHVRSMNDSSMRVAFEESLGRNLGKDAIIVDTRFNGGGNIHEPLSDFFSGKVWFDIVPHGQHVGAESRNKWVKPSIVIMGESNYSDAHLFPYQYKLKEGGKTLGMPVPGTGTFVWWERQIDPTLVFGIPMGGWRAPNGRFLENYQMEPDIKVRLEPGVMISGRDQQIEVAVRELMQGNE